MSEFSFHSINLNDSDNKYIPNLPMNSNRNSIKRSDSSRIDSNRINSNRIDSNRIDSNRIDSNRISNRIDSNRISKRSDSNRITKRSDSNRITKRSDSNRITKRSDSNRISKRSDSKRSDSNRITKRSDSNRISNRSISKRSDSNRSISKRSDSGRSIQSFTKKNKQKQAIQIVGKFMKKTEHKRRSKFLQTICSDSGVCIAFGKERTKIFDFFNGFTNFDFLTNTRSIGSESANGFVKELEYEREKYKAHAILKSSIKWDSDNLLYEYVVGQVINKYFMNRFPCFVETYGHYRYRSGSGMREMFRTAGPGKIDLKQILTPYDKTSIPIAESCSASIYMCILIQHINGATSLGDKVFNTTEKGRPNQKKDISFIMNDLLYSLFQVYYPLCLMKNNYTHYDLHADNVILYKPSSDKYIQYHYHYNNGTKVSFKSQYISKIIDYGRSFFDVDQDEIYPGIRDSMDYYNMLCELPECNEGDDLCGNETGYGWMEQQQGEYKHYINSSIRNMSHDLRLLSILHDNLDKVNFQSKRSYVELHNMLNKVYYKTLYGTPEVVNNYNNSKIVNVCDAENAIMKLIQDHEQVNANNNYYSGMSKMGDLYIYEDKPMKYIPA